MDQFLAFLSESESLCESAEAEIERNPLMFKVSGNFLLFYYTYKKNKDFQKENLFFKENFS